MKNPFQKNRALIGALAAALLAGCGNSENFVFTNTVNPVNPVNPVVQPPVAQNDSFQALGNATLQQAAAGVLANDTLNGGTITAFDALGSNGGAIALNTDGSFTYTPVLGFVGAETFTYTLSNADGDSTATVTLTSTGFGRFVDNSGANGTGTQASPFNNLADAAAAAQNGDTVYVSRGDGTNTGMTGGITLPQGVKLIGEGTGLILGQTIEPAGQAPTIQGPIDCQGNNLIQGFTIDGSTDELIRINGVGDVTINQNTLLNPTNEHVDCDNVTGTVAISNNTLNNPPNNSSMDYIRVDNTDTNANVSITGNTFMNTGQNSSNVDSLAEMYANGTSAMNLICSNNIANGTVTDEFDYGFYFENRGTGSCTMQVHDNQLSNFNLFPIGFLAFPGPLTGTVTGNTVSNVTGIGLLLHAGGGTQTVSGNTISNTSSFGLDLEFDGPAGGTFVVENNTISNSNASAVYIGEQDDNTDNRVALRNNVFTGTTAAEDVFIFTDDNGTICCDITGNTFNKNCFFDEQGGGAINVERRDAGADGGPLESVNTFISGIPVYDSGTINSQAAGFCAIP